MKRLALMACLFAPVMLTAKKKMPDYWDYSYTGPAGAFSAWFYDKQEHGTVAGTAHQTFRVLREGRSDAEFQLLLISICDHMGGEGLHE